MAPQGEPFPNHKTGKPPRHDRLIVLLMSVGVFLLLLPLTRLIHPRVIGGIVLVTVIGFPVITINVLLPFSRWKTPLEEPPRKAPARPKKSRKPHQASTTQESSKTEEQEPHTQAEQRPPATQAEQEQEPPSVLADICQELGIALPYERNKEEVP
jgi:hypothetical protein